MIRSRRIGFAHATLALFAIAIVVKSARLQLVQHKQWLAKAERQQTSAKEVPAPRGEILDATHRVLAESRDMVRLEIQPREVRDPKKLREALAKLGIERQLIARATDTTSRYITVPGRFLAVDAAPAMALRGVYSFSVIERSYAVSEGARGILGHVDGDNKPVDGLELALDSLLRGVPGTATIIRDSRGQGRESPTEPGTAPTKGNSIVLTINADLQEIAEKSLADAVARMGAEGGDIVILDPHTGEILAMASRRLDPRQTSATVITEPFEPGSTKKPIIAAGLLQRGRVKDSDSVDTGNGAPFEINGRLIHDEHHIGRAPLSVVLRESSNIGIVKFGMRLTEGETYETLRDFGFGLPTGIPYPTESGGSLHSPRSWSKQSMNSMDMGYEVAVTPLQLAAAYAPFANGGELVEPALIKEIIGPDGAVRYRHTPRVVRRVISPAVSEKMRHMLLDVVDEGTALTAQLDNYLLAGKTGTPRRSVRGRYTGTYNPNFVSLFPGDKPQYVMVVKVTAPQSSIFAANTAAPVTKTILQAAIAARNAALDRSELASSAVPVKKDSAKRIAQAGMPHTVGQLAVARPETVSIDPEDGKAPFVVTLPASPEPPAPRTLKPIPDVRGLDVRDAVRSLHSAGFRVQLARAGSIGGPGGAAATAPSAGAMAPTGTLVRLLFDY
jgi:cell division protein FtsI (penicillin-binding protein 3)